MRRKLAEGARPRGSRCQAGATEKGQQAYNNKWDGGGLTEGIKSYQQAGVSKSKKAGMKREGSPYNPYKRKARGKENNLGANSTGLFACERPRGREGIRKRLIKAAVEDALKAFCGTRKSVEPRDGRDSRRPSFSDEQLWAKFAWKFGWGLLRELTLQGKAEMAEHRKPLADKDKPKVLQDLINPFWKGGKRTTAREAKRGREKRGDTEVATVRTGNGPNRAKVGGLGSIGSGRGGIGSGRGGIGSGRAGSGGQTGAGTAMGGVK